MIPIHELKQGDYVITDFEGVKRPGAVKRINPDEKQACVETEVQEFWYEEDQLLGIPLDESQLMELNFKKEILPDGSIKYMKGSFRIVVPQGGDFSQLDIWYREDFRHHPDIHFVHQLQNHYLQMTKVHLTDEAMA
ncbi:MAG: hypothetical protein JSS67_03250 [Bacteroidetes bacterium]|nr:hypothetical protein [Bacteroidota bacterium]